VAALTLSQALLRATIFLSTLHMQQQKRRAALVCLYCHHVEKERVNVWGCTYALR
jgi:hypothetical protein